MKKLFIVFTVLFLNSTYSQDAWEQINDFLFETTIKTSFSTNEKGYILLHNNNNSINEFYSYDTNLDSYEQRANFPILGHHYFTSFVINNEGYILLKDINTTEAVVLLYKYNEAQNTWEQKASALFDHFGFGDFSGTAFSINDKGYLASSGGGPNGNFREYDPVTNNWIAKNNYPGPNEGRNRDFTIGDIGYLAFGFDDFDYYPILWSYNQNTETWTQLEDIPWGGGYYASVSFAIGEYGYVGLNPNVGSNIFYRYIPSSNTWEQIENCGYWASVCFSFSINNIGYVGAGSVNSSNTKQVWSLDPELLALGNNDITTISLYPNPVKETLNVSGLESDSSYTIYEINGRVISSGAILESLINVSILIKGIYIVKIISNDNKVINKLIVKE